MGVTQAAIRQLTLKYMGRKSHNSPFDLSKIPTPEEVQDFAEEDEHRAPCCTIDDFRPDLNGTPRSAWNTSVADVFVEAYMSDGAYPCDNAALVEKYFVRHLRYLIGKFKERHTEREIIAARMKAKRRRERRNYVSHSST